MRRVRLRGKTLSIALLALSLTTRTVLAQTGVGEILAKEAAQKIVDECIKVYLADIQVKNLTSPQGWELANRIFTAAASRVESRYESRISDLNSAIMRERVAYSARDYQRYEEAKKKRIAELQSAIERVTAEKKKRLVQVQESKRAFMSRYESYWKENDKRVKTY